MASRSRKHRFNAPALRPKTPGRLKQEIPPCKGRNTRKPIRPCAMPPGRCTKKAPSTEGRGNGKARFLVHRDRMEAYDKQGHTAKAIFQAFSVELAMSYPQFTRLFAVHIKGKQPSAPASKAKPTMPAPVQQVAPSPPVPAGSAAQEPEYVPRPIRRTGRMTGTAGKDPRDYI